MRALVWHGPWDMRSEEVPDPVPGPGEVLVRITATGICGSDIHGFSGETGRRHPGQVMGHETVGTVEGLGPGVEDDLPLDAVVTINPLIPCGECPACRAGREQACPTRRVIGVTAGIVSAFAERIAVPRDNVLRLPDTMPVEYGALVEPLAVGYHAARRGACTADDAVLVIGGGPIGQACVLAARRWGATRVAVTEPDASRRELAASLGATGVDPGGDDPGAAVTAALGEPPTLVLDAVGSSRSLADALIWSGLDARVVLVGMAAPSVELPAYAISTEERTLVGSFCYSRRDFAETAEWVGSAPPELAGLVQDRVGLADAPQAFTDLARGTSDASKVLVLPHESSNRRRAPA